MVVTVLIIMYFFFVKKYSASNKKWIKVANMFDKRKRFSACTFMDKIYIFGGSFPSKLCIGKTVFGV